MPQIPATREEVSVEKLYELIEKDLRFWGGEVAPEVVLDIFKYYSDRYDTDVNSPYNMGYYCLDADVAALAAMYETDRRGANIVVPGQHPATQAFELISIDILLRTFGIDPAKGHGHYTSGGTESNNTGLIVAASHKLSHNRLSSEDYEADYCTDGDGRTEPYEFIRHGSIPLKVRPAVYITAQTAECVDKNVRNLLGTASLRQVPVDKNLRMDPEALKRLLENDAKSRQYLPFYVVGTVGATPSGIVDPLDAIGALCREHDVWLHADAPWGGFSAFSEKLKGACLKGIEYADSITFDPHKTLVPIGSGSCGLFLTRHRDAVEKAFNVSGQRVRTHDYEFMSLQGSRTSSGLRTLVGLLQPTRLKNQVECATELGDFLREELERAGWEITNNTPLPVVCAVHPKLKDGQLTTADVVGFLSKQGVLAKAEDLRPGEAPSLRLGVISRRTNKATIRQVVEHLDRFLAQY